MRKSTLAPCALAFLALGSPAQELDAARLDALDAKIRFRLDDDGQVLIAPDPVTGSDDFVPVLAERAGVSFAFVGVFGFAAFLCSGPTDLASFADAPRFFERLDAEDAVLLQAIGRPTADASWPQVLETLLALRAVEARGLKAAIPLVDKVAADQGADPFVRRAAAETAAVLHGDPRPPLDARLEDLPAVLARVPAEAQVVARIDAFRLPPVRRITEWGRVAGQAAVRQSSLGAPELYDEADYLQGMRISESATVLPYELARRYGNHRIDRIVLAVRPPEGGMGSNPSLWASIDGVFDMKRVRAELEATSAEFAEGEGGAVRMQLGGGFELELGARRAVLSTLGFDSEDRENDRDGLAEALTGDAQIALWVAPDLALPDVARRVKPEWMRLTVPQDGTGALRLEGAWADPTGAAAFRGLLASVPGLTERAVGSLESFEPVLDALDALETELDGDRLTATLPIPAVDMESLLRELIASGLFD